MVMGPTPPGTGVMNEHLGATSSNFTSPVNLNPDFLEVSGTRGSTYINNDSAFLDHFRLNKVRLSQRSNDDVRFLAFLYQVFAAAVAYGHCGIAG